MQAPERSRSWATSTRTPCCAMRSTRSRAAVTEVPLVDITAQSNRSGMRALQQRLEALLLDVEQGGEAVLGPQRRPQRLVDRDQVGVPRLARQQVVAHLQRADRHAHAGVRLDQM